MTPRKRAVLHAADVAAARRIRAGRIEPGADKRPSLYAQIQRDAVLGWSGILPRDQVHRDADIDRKPDLSLIASDFLRMAGMNVPPTKAGRIEAGMKMANNVSRSYASVDDFPSWLGNTAQRSVTLGYNDAPETWRYLCQINTVQGFKQFHVVSLPEFPSPAEIKENAKIPRLQLGSDSKESSALVSHTALFGLSRQMLVNNDLTGLTTIPQALGRAASRAVGDKFFYVLVANGLMSDGEALFSAAHGNLISSGAAPSVTELDAGRTLMTAQRGPSNSILNLRPAILLCPTVLESTAVALRSAMSDATGADDSLTPGFSAGRLAVVTDARLDDADTAAWYLLCDPRKHSGIGVHFLEGGTLPLVEQVNTFVSDSLDYKLMHDFACVPTDYRSWVKNAGA